MNRIKMLIAFFTIGMGMLSVATAQAGNIGSGQKPPVPSNGGSLGTVWPVQNTQAQNSPTPRPDVQCLREFGRSHPLESQNAQVVNATIASSNCNLKCRVKGRSGKMFDLNLTYPKSGNYCRWNG